MRKIKEYKMVIIWDDGTEQDFHPSDYISEAIEDYLDALEDEENLEITMEAQET